MFVPSNLLHCSLRDDHVRIVARTWTNNNLPEASQKSSNRMEFGPSHLAIRAVQGTSGPKNEYVRDEFLFIILSFLFAFCPFSYFLGGGVGECMSVGMFQKFGTPKSHSQKGSFKWAIRGLGLKSWDTLIYVYIYNIYKVDIFSYAYIFFSMSQVI